MFIVKRTVALLMLITAAASVALGQANAKVSGTVTDPNGAAVPGATVKLINQATKIEVEITSNEDGYFNFVNVNPAMYTLRVEVQGFKGVQSAPFDVGVSEAVTQNVSLTIGSVSETVEVSTGAELIQQASSDLGTVIAEKVVQDLPLNGRNFTQLLTLTPGVTPVSTSQNRNVGGVEGNVGLPGSGFSDPSFHGQENRSKLYFYDGIINTNVRGPTYIVIPNIDLIQEFKVVGHDSRTDYGRIPRVRKRSRRAARRRTQCAQLRVGSIHARSAFLQAHLEVLVATFFAASQSSTQTCRCSRVFRSAKTGSCSSEWKCSTYSIFKTGTRPRMRT